MFGNHEQFPLIAPERLPAGRFHTVIGFDRYCKYMQYMQPARRKQMTISMTISMIFCAFSFALPGKGFRIFLSLLFLIALALVSLCFL